MAAAYAAHPERLIRAIPQPLPFSPSPFPLPLLPSSPFPLLPLALEAFPLLTLLLLLRLAPLAFLPLRLLLAL